VPMRVALAVVMLVAACGGDQPLPWPTPIEVPGRIAAIGDTSELPAALQRALEPGPDYRMRYAPAGDDWLANHPEPGQTFEQYARSSPNRPDSLRRVLYLLPLGDLPADQAPPLADLADVVHAFFTLEVRILPAVPLAEVTARQRINAGTGKPQLLAPDLLRWLPARLPEDAYALMAVTMADLYPDPAWNFVFGQAMLSERVGVQSFARYDPAFFDEPRPTDWRRTLVRRSAQVLVHEIAHMFGMEHCVHWHCVVAGANHQDEFDHHPLHLCPVCLRKLHWAAPFDPAAREAALAAIWLRLDLPAESAWSARRAARLRAPP
jgi:archaemetzincin